MKRFMITLCFLALIVATMSCVVMGADNAKPLSDVVQKYGQLQVVNGRLCDQKGTPVQLKGMSTYGLQGCTFAKDTMKNLVKDWHINVIRAAMYLDNGYIGHEDLMRQRLKSIVDQAIQYGVYVIIDWHILSEHDPNLNKNEAKAFFEEMASTYGKYPNVIYEICNEPNSSKTMEVTWKGQIKPYAEFIIPAIRAIDPDNIIIVGTDTWCQGVANTADDPLNFTNVAYALHFYAGSHQQWLRDKADYALSKGVAIFVTEWGTTNATAAGKLYYEEAQRWIDWMAEHKISWCNWSFSNFPEDASALNPTTGMNGPWKNSQLSESGEWVKSKILENN